MLCTCPCSCDFNTFVIFFEFDLCRVQTTHLHPLQKQKFVQLAWACLYQVMWFPQATPCILCQEVGHVTVMWFPQATPCILCQEVGHVTVMWFPQATPCILCQEVGHVTVMWFPQATPCILCQEVGHVTVMWFPQPTQCILCQEVGHALAKAKMRCHKIFLLVSCLLKYLYLGIHDPCDKTFPITLYLYLWKKGYTSDLNSLNLLIVLSSEFPTWKTWSLSFDHNNSFRWNSFTTKKLNLFEMHFCIAI